MAKVKKAPARGIDRMSKDQRAKHREIVTKVINSIDRLWKQNPHPNLTQAKAHMLAYNTYEVVPLPNTEFSVKEVSNG